MDTQDYNFVLTHLIFFSVDLSSCSENDIDDTDDSENARDLRWVKSQISPLAIPRLL